MRVPSVALPEEPARAWLLPERNERGQNSNYTRLTIYTDGASRGNPGLAASGIHIVDDRGQHIET